MKISTKGRYALRVLLDLAEHGTEKNVSIREIASRQDISDKYLEGIVSRLHVAGLVRSVRGKYGGYRLTKEPHEYNVFDILCAAEDSMALVACLEDKAPACPQVEACKTVRLWEYLQNDITTLMTSISLQDVIEGKFPARGMIE